MLLGAWITKGTVLEGVVSGMVFGLVAMGIVLVYRSTRVINFAVANLGMVGAGLFALLQREYRVPFWLAAAAGLLAGVLFGALVELTVIRRLFNAPRVIVLVATIGVAQLSLLLWIALPDIDVPGAKFPVPIGSTFRFAGFSIDGPQLTILMVVPAIAAALGWLLNRTSLGKAIKASADNPDLARLAGISPKLVSTAVWAIGGGLATVALSLLGGGGSANSINTLGPSTMVRALAAAVLAGMVSFPRAFAAGVALGVVQAVVKFNMTDQPGVFDFLLFLFVLAAVYRQSRSGLVEARTFAYGAKSRPVPERLKSIWWVRSLDRIGLILLAAGAVVLPIIVTQSSRHLTYTLILTTTLAALSLTVLTGWSGQLSLGQMAFAGIGAFLTARLVSGLNFDLSWGSFRLFKAGLQPMPFPLALVIATLVGAGLAALVGTTSLRIRGLFLAVSTFAFGFAASQYLYQRPLLKGKARDSVTFKRTSIFGIDMKSQRSYYYFALCVTVLVVIAIGRLRRTGVARTTIAVRDNADTAAAYTVSATRTKLRAFALGGGLATLAGGLLGLNLQSIPDDRYFTVNDSLQLVAVVVIGGIGSVAGAVIGAAWVVGLPALFPDNDVVPLLASSIGLLLLLMYFPGGFVQLGYSLRDTIIRAMERRRPDTAGSAPRASISTLGVGQNRPPLTPGVPVLRASDVSVRFGGNLAVNSASIEVNEGEVVGLIGTNGAGKSTLINAIGGFVPSEGRIELFGTDIAGLPTSQRAVKGLGRTFQAANLFPELTVTETVLVALEARHRTGSLVAALISPAAARRERARRTQAGEIIHFLGLGSYAEAYIADLSTGTRRIVELAGLIALDARMLCLDEPTAGLAQRETEAFGPLILQIRRELDASMLIIEHDMPLIMSVSDRVYCLEAGRVIAAGTPSAVRNDPAVIASYLGTDERAIERSDATR